MTKKGEKKERVGIRWGMGCWEGKELG